MMPHDGGVTFQLNGTTLLEGVHVAGGLQAKFAPGSGLRAQFTLTGASDSQGYSLSGRGAIWVHTMEFSSATVSASPRGILIESSVQWQDTRKLLFMAPDANGLWHGGGSFEEGLQCSVTPIAVVSIRLAIELGADTAAMSADCSLEGIVDHVRLTPRSGEGVQQAIAALRVLLVMALERKIRDRVESLEVRLEDWEAEHDLQTFDVDNSAPIVTETTRSRQSVPSGAYLSARTHQLHSGYLPRVRPAGPNRSPVSSSTGYLARPDPTAERRGYLSKERLSFTVTGEDRKLSAAPKAHSVQRPIVPSADHNEMVYSIIRFKDILRALALASQKEE